MAAAAQKELSDSEFTYDCKPCPDFNNWLISLISSVISNPASKIIQTDTSSVILRKHPRFSTIQKVGSYKTQKLKLYNKIPNLVTQGKVLLSNHWKA